MYVRLLGAKPTVDLEPSIINVILKVMHVLSEEYQLIM